MGALLALASAVSFGVSDVSGAIAARRASAVRVTFGVQLAGFLALVPLLLVLPGTPTWRAIWLGAVAGTVGTAGLVLYFRSMARAPIGVISPVAALVGAAVPVGWGVVVTGDDLGILQYLGILAGLVAVVAVAYVPGTPLRAQGSSGPVTAVVAGSAFGLFFVVLSTSPAESGLWPLLGSRLSGTVVVVLLLMVGRQRAAGSLTGTRRLIVLSGVSDVVANAFFLLGTRVGLLSLVALLTSLYPVVALLLARLVLHERLSRLQAGGVLLALAATGMLVGG